MYSHNEKDYNQINYIYSVSSLNDNLPNHRQMASFTRQRAHLLILRCRLPGISITHIRALLISVQN